MDQRRVGLCLRDERARSQQRGDRIEDRGSIMGVMGSSRDH
jgi:hypothetical protein